LHLLIHQHTARLGLKKGIRFGVFIGELVVLSGGAQREKHVPQRKKNAFSEEKSTK
jgi:hypothetical protein